MSWRLKRTKHLIVLAVSLAVAFVTTARAEILNVPGDFPTIQAAIGAAVRGDEVVVAPGEYFENINFLGKAITVRSTDPTDPATVISTIINGGGSGSVVTCTSGEGPDTVLSGFVITEGFSKFGGGMHNSDSSPTVTNCTFSGNTATFGGGGMNNIGGSSPMVTNCTFINNTAGKDTGGGMYNIVNSSPTVTNCTFIGNTASDGGGMYNVFSSSPTVTNCTFSNNTAAFDGGGMHNAFSSSPTVTNCTFSGNTAEFGGGMLNAGASPTLTNCTFSGNTAGDTGGGMLNDFSNPTLTNCQICTNTPDQIDGSFTDGGGNVINDLYCPPPAPECLGDLDDSGDVGVKDLLMLLGNWGPCP